MKLLTALLILICLSQVWASDRASQDYSMLRDGHLVLKTGTVALHIQAHDRDRLTIDGPVGIQLPTPQGSERQWTLDLTGMSKAVASADVRVTVPMTASLEISADSARVVVVGMHGRHLQIFNAAGLTEVRDSQPERLDIESVQGRQIVHASGRQSSRLKSISGAIDAIGLTGRARLSTLTGAMTIETRDFQELDIETVSGHIAADLRPGERATAQVISHDGPQDLIMSASAPLDARLRSYTGALSSDFERVEIAPGTWRIRQEPATITLQARSFSAPIGLRAGPDRAQAKVMVLVYRSETGPVEVAEFGHEQHVDVRLRAGEYALVALPASTDLIFVRGDSPGSLPKHGRHELGVERWGEDINCFELQPDYKDARRAWMVQETSRALLIARHFTLEHGPCPSDGALEELRRVIP